MQAFQLSPSPFMPPGRPRVTVGHGQDGYTVTREALIDWDLSAAKGKRVLLKPNAGRVARPGSGIVTNPSVLAAAIDAFVEVGAEVIVAESPIAGVDTHEALAVSGMAAVAREREVALLDMDARAAVKTSLPDGVAIRSLMLCPELREADLVVSIPVMKTHMHTGVTLSVKNMKGCLWRRSKVKLHMLRPVAGSSEKPIDIAIADMSWALRPHFAIVDGTVGLEGLGPSAGSPKQLGCVVAGADALAVDATACALMGIDARSVPHLRIAAERQYGIIDLDRIDISPANWRDFISPFALPPESVSIEFPGVEVIDRNSCSACQSTLLMFLKRYGDSLREYLDGDPIHVAIGKGCDQVPAGTLCIGNCTGRHQEDTIFVHGCPPVASEILSRLSGKPCADTRDGHRETTDTV